MVKKHKTTGNNQQPHELDPWHALSSAAQIMGDAITMLRLSGQYRPAARQVLDMADSIHRLGLRLNAVARDMYDDGDTAVISNPRVPRAVVVTARDPRTIRRDGATR